MTDNSASTSVPGGQRIRVGFIIGGEVRPVLWFLPDGNDLYWGGSTPGRTVEGEQPLVTSDGRAEITIPRNLDDIIPTHSKYSYHHSGQIHHKREGKFTGEPGKISAPLDVTAPLCIGGLVTKRADLYPVGRSLTRGGAAALGIELDDEGVQLRHYLEFFVSPEGTFDFPPMVLAPNVSGHNVIYTQSLTPHLILGIRHAAVGGEFANIEPEVEIWTRLHKEDQGASPGPASDQPGSS